MTLQDHCVWYYRQGKVFLRITELPRDGASIPTQSGWLENLYSHHCLELVLYLKFYSWWLLMLKHEKEGQTGRGKSLETRSDNHINTEKAMVNKWIPVQESLQNKDSRSRRQ